MKKNGWASEVFAEWFIAGLAGALAEQLVSMAAKRIKRALKRKKEKAAAQRCK